MTIKPLLDRILVSRPEGSSPDVGDVALPDPAEARPTRGKVLAFDRGKTHEAGQCRDEVLAAIDAAFAATGGL